MPSPPSKSTASVNSVELKDSGASSNGRTDSPELSKKRDGSPLQFSSLIQFKLCVIDFCQFGMQYDSSVVVN